MQFSNKFSPMSAADAQLPTSPVSAAVAQLPTSPMSAADAQLPTSPVSATVAQPVTLSNLVNGHMRQQIRVRSGSQYPRYQLIWYIGTNDERSLDEARVWSTVVLVLLHGPRGHLTPEESDEIRTAVLGCLGEGFHCTVVLDRRNASRIRIEIRLNRAVTASQAALDAFYMLSHEQDRQSKRVVFAAAESTDIDPG
jgi:hypothetical protein